MDTTKQLLDKINKFRELCIDFATGSSTKYEDYENGRNELLAEPGIQAVLPKWLIKNRWGSQFWPFIKAKSPTYQGRRDFLNEQFSKIIEEVEGAGAQPISISVQAVLKGLENDDLETLWKKVHARKATDTEGAITASRTLVEATLKFILDHENVSYTKNDDLFDLYNKVAKLLNLSPKGHNEKLFKQILGGLTATVQGLAELRNAYGDAHGKGKGSYRAEPRHAELAINLAGSMCSFLISTYSQKARS